MEKIEVIVVGKDEPGLVKEDDMVKFIRTEQRAIPATARNIGVRHAQGDVLFFIDADCVADQNWIRNLMGYHENGISVVGGAIAFDTSNFWTLGDNIAAFHPQLVTSPKGVLAKGVLGTANFSIQKMIFSKLGGFNEAPDLMYSEDNEFQYRLRKTGHTIYFAPEAIVHHHPPRASMRAVIRHAQGYGRSLVTLNRIHPERLKTKPLTQRNRYFLIALAPFRSFYHTVKLLRQHAWLRKYFYVMPVVCMFSFAWYFSIFREMGKVPLHDVNLTQGG
jgi:GT2 family glycosyltransferase